MTSKRVVKISGDTTQVALYDDKHGKSIIINQIRENDHQFEDYFIIKGKEPPMGIIQINKDEAFKLAYALMSLASEL